VINVYDSEGKSPQSTPYGKSVRAKEFLPVSRIFKTLKPNESIEEDSVVSDLYNLHSSGQYSIQVERADPLDPKITLKSNEITVTVSN
jgi:hypothetical protein